MSKSDPRSSQCGAHGRRSGEPCQRWVVGGGRCYLHGGATPQAKRSRDERLALMDLQLKPSPPSGKTAGEMLVSAAEDTRVVVERIKVQLADREQQSPADLEVLGRWLDRLARTAKMITESRADESLIEQRQRVSRAQANVMVAAVEAALGLLDLTAEQRQQVPNALRAALASIRASQEQPLRGEVVRHA